MGSLELAFFLNQSGRQNVCIENCLKLPFSLQKQFLTVILKPDAQQPFDWQVLHTTFSQIGLRCLLSVGFYTKYSILQTSVITFLVFRPAPSAVAAFSCEHIVPSRHE